MPTDAWQRLSDELDRWAAMGAVATFWWRDDDAAAATPALDALIGVAEDTPLVLAVIPAKATADLTRSVAHVKRLTVIQHGWAHVSHLPGGRNEYPAGRPRIDVVRELVDGQAVLSERFGAQFLAAFAPPWHAFDDDFLPLLETCGVAYISRLGARTNAFAADRVGQINVHVSLIAWTQPPSFGDESVYVEALRERLIARRSGRSDQAEPTGVLTHHLIQDPQSYVFVRRLVALVNEHPAGRWLDGQEVFEKREMS